MPPAYESESDGALESRQYYLQNWRADLVSMIGEDGVFPGWFKYSAYGQHQWISAADIDGGSVDGFRDGVVNGDDSDAFNKTWFEAGDLRADVNYDGAVTANDLAAFLAVSATDGNPPESRVMYAGYTLDPLDDDANGGGQYGIYHVRHRVYSPELGRWTRRDPLGYVTDLCLYEYVGSSPIDALDCSGLINEKLCEQAKKDLANRIRLIEEKSKEAIEDPLDLLMQFQTDPLVDKFGDTAIAG